MADQRVAVACLNKAIGHCRHVVIVPPLRVIAMRLIRVSNVSVTGVANDAASRPWLGKCWETRFDHAAFSTRPFGQRNNQSKFLPLNNTK